MISSLNGANSPYFTNIMEYRNGTGPLDPDSDSDSVMMTPVIANGEVVDYRQDMSLSDGREMFKYGTNPLDNDTDGDMMPDFYSSTGLNETNDNWSSYMKIQVQWIEVTPQNWKPIQFSDGQITRPQLDWTWFTHDATDPMMLLRMRITMENGSALGASVIMSHTTTSRNTMQL